MSESTFCMYFITYVLIGVLVGLVYWKVQDLKAKISRKKSDVVLITSWSIVFAYFWPVFCCYALIRRGLISLSDFIDYHCLGVKPMRNYEA